MAVSSERTSGDQHEDAPQPVDDRRNRRQQLREKHERLLEAAPDTARR